MRTTPMIVSFAAALCTATLLAAAAPQSAPAKPAKPTPAAPSTPAAPPAAASTAAGAFDRMKSLAGTWEGTMEGLSHPITVTYRVIAAGSAVVETLMGGSPEEMETIFHMDGDRLLATHYCAGGNQPRMKAAKITPDSISFEMVDATNLPDRNAPHMGALVIQFLDKDHIKNSWTSFKDGKAEEHANFDLRRAAPTAAKPAPSAPAAPGKGAK